MSKIFTLTVIIYLISACTVLPKPQTTVSTYDFGSQAASNTAQLPNQSNLMPKSILIANATTPSWLESTAIYYRLLYHNPTQTYAYANSRWIAAPAALFTQQIRNRIITDTLEFVTKDSATAKTDYVLHIELEEFMQLFDTATESRIAIGFHASLIERNTRKLIAQKSFNRTEKTPSADAAGAVLAFSTTSHELIDELVNWLLQELSRF